LLHYLFAATAMLFSQILNGSKALYKSQTVM
jgi:hypothetical protein